MLPSLKGPLQLRDNLRLTPNTRKGLWPASASGRQQSSCLLASATAIAAELSLPIVCRRGRRPRASSRSRPSGV